LLKSKPTVIHYVQELNQGHGEDLQDRYRNPKGHSGHWTSRIDEDQHIALIDEISGGNMRAYQNGRRVEPMELGKLML